MNLIVGATGLVGSEICRKLRSKGEAVRALVRPTAASAKLEELRNIGVTLVHGDLKEPRSLRAACDGVSTILSTASSSLSRQAGDSIESVDRDGQLSLIDSAKDRGVRRFIYVSFPPMATDFPLQRAKRAVEQRLVSSGMEYTILQPTFFTEVWLSPALGFDIGAAKARIYGNGEGRVSWISYADVAEFAVQAIENQAARNAALPLGGPGALSPLKVVQMCEQLTGRKFSLEHVSEGALRASKQSASDSLQESFTALMLGLIPDQPIDMQALLKSFPVTLTSVPDYLARITTGSRATGA